MAHTPKLPRARSTVPNEPVDRIWGPFRAFAGFEASSGILLLVMTVIALVWANTAGAGYYHHLFHETTLTLGAGDWALTKSVGHFINDGLMAVFFLLVGLEIKRELLVGELNSLRKATLPIFAAAGGMVVPALIYVGFNVSGGVMHGWGVPMATDIAFALGVMALLGPRVPIALRVFLTSLAIVDDLGALLVIALFYTEELKTDALLFSAVCIGVLVFFNLLRVRHPLPYFLIGAVLWYLVLKSGVHATIAGVVLAFTIPATSKVDTKSFLGNARANLDRFDREGHDRKNASTNPIQRAVVFAMRDDCEDAMPPLQRLEHVLIPWVSFLIIPIFALANAGVPIGGGGGEEIPEVADSPAGPLGAISLGVFFGLVLGKPIGVVLFSWIAVKLKVGDLPRGSTWRQLVGAGVLAGIGFTMALFIANLAFLPGGKGHGGGGEGEGMDEAARIAAAIGQAELDSAKLAVLAASAVCGVVGLIILATAPSKDAGGGDADHGH